MEKTLKPFKSERAARIAYGKAERAYEAARSATIQKNYEMRETGYLHEELVPFETAESEAFEKMAAIYRKAEAEKIWIKSWHLGHNPTRELILNNCD